MTPKTTPSDVRPAAMRAAVAPPNTAASMISRTHPGTATTGGPPSPGTRKTPHTAATPTTRPTVQIQRAAPSWATQPQ